jgi:carboxymethylenebutenolidase
VIGAGLAASDFGDALTDADVDHLVLTYHGAPHSFFDRSHGKYESANAHAWASMLAFIELNA